MGDLSVFNRQLQRAAESGLPTDNGPPATDYRPPSIQYHSSFISHPFTDGLFGRLSTGRHVLALLLSVALLGCHGGDRWRSRLDDAGRYEDLAAQVEFSPCEAEPASAPLHCGPPRGIRELRDEQLWDWTLAECLHAALSNSRILRTRGQFLSPGNVLLANPDQAPSIYDPAIRNSGVLFGARGVAAARADFDTQLTTSMIWGRDERVQNNLFESGGLPPGATLVEESAAFVSQLQKTLPTGGTLALNHNWDYSGNNVPARLFQSVYTGFVQAEYRQPLLAGFGTEFTEIAGPVNRNLQGVSGVSQGIVIARINVDISLADFEVHVGNLLKDVEDAYWDLLLAYEVYAIERESRDKIRDVLEKVEAREGPRADEAQARDTYYEAEARTDIALANLYQIEAQLRRLMGLAGGDERLIRPADRPIEAEYVPNWELSLAEALTQRVELRRQMQNIRSLELQRTAALSLVKPRLDFVSNYQVNAFGDHLIAATHDDGVTRQGFNSAYGTLAQNKQTGWNLGVEMSMPLGQRSARSQVRNLELRLAKARTLLSEQELEISHELANAFVEVDRWYLTSQTARKRQQAARERIEAFEAAYEALPGQVIDPILRSQVSLAQAKIQHQRSLVEHTKAVTNVNYRKGTLLESNNVVLAEGREDFASYRAAIQTALSRSRALEEQEATAVPPAPAPPAPMDEAHDEWMRDER